MDPVKIIAAAVTGWALLQSTVRQGRQDIGSMGPVRPVSPAEEDQFELLWADTDGRSVLEGPGRTRVVPMPVPEVLRGLSTEWRRFLVDESSTKGQGTGTVELWVRRRAILRSVPSSTWAFRNGQPVRTLTLKLASKRQISGVLP